MSLIKGNTKWVLFLSSREEPETRHVLDLAFGLHCLETAGIIQADIFIYIDGKQRKLINKLILNGSVRGHLIKESKDFFTDQLGNSHKSMVMFVTGHGGIQGIDATLPITPHKLLSCIKTTPTLKNAIVYLGQCYAGIFNYMKAGRNHTPEGSHDPEVVVIGATNLHESISASTEENLSSGLISWVANLFLLHTFKWIASPIDVDGDGKFTVIDSYKYAGAASNYDNKKLKIDFFRYSIDLHNKLDSAIKDNQLNPDAGKKLKCDAIAHQYNDILGVQHIHQECWILNSIPAQNIEL